MDYPQGHPLAPRSLLASASYMVDEPSRDLTAGEVRIVRELILGHTERMIALRIGCKRSTVHRAISAIHRKLSVSSRARLVALAIARGIVPLEEVRILLGDQVDGCGGCGGVKEFC